MPRKKPSLFSFEPSKTPINVTLHQSNLIKDKNGRSVLYGKVRQRKITVRGLLAKMEKSRPSFVSKEAMFFVAEELSKLMMEKLKEGYALELLDFGTLFITMKGKINPTDTELQVSKHFDIGFKPSKEAREALKQLQVRNIVPIQPQHYIRDIKEAIAPCVPHIEQTGDIKKIRKEYITEVSGKAINVKGEGSGLYLAPVVDTTYKSDKADWILIDHLVDNTPTKVRFYLKDSIAAGFYKIVIITKASGSDNELKSFVTIVSDTIEITERT